MPRSRCRYRLTVLTAVTAAVATALAVPASAPAGGGPENVFVVVRPDSWASMAVANEFIQLRNIPPSNVGYLENVGSPDATNVEAFRKNILRAVLEIIRSRPINGQIDYIVYSSDFPTAVHFKSDLKGSGRPKVMGGAASLTGLTYLYALTLDGDPMKYASLRNNLYFRRPVFPGRQSMIHTMHVDDRRTMMEANRKLSSKEYKAALEMYSALQKKYPGVPSMHYLLAYGYAQMGQTDKALDALDAGYEAGFARYKLLERAPLLEPIREHPRFKAIIEKMKGNYEKVEINSHGFQARYAFTDKGEIAAPREGIHYVLSAMLAVTSGRGNSVSEAMDYLRRSASADGRQPKGTIYFMNNSDVRARTRLGLIEPAIGVLKQQGVAAEMLQGKLPRNKDDVMGLLTGTAGFNWPSSKSTILPGAICEHLTSWGGVMGEFQGQTPLSAFLRYGAAGSSGTVTEPYAIAAKFPSPFMHVHYARGCSLAEAFYQSVAGPYQLLVVGDPLCMPWAQRPIVKLDGIEGGQKLTGTVSLSASAAAIGEYRLFVDGVLKAASNNGELELDTTSLADGHHRLAVVAIAADAIETQGRAELDVIVDNHGQAGKLSARTSGKAVLWDQPLKVALALPEAEKIDLLHNARVLASVTGAEGTVQIDPLKLGQGTVTLQAVGQVNVDGQNVSVRSEPLSVDIRPPFPTRPALSLEAGKALKPHPIVIGPDGQARTFAGLERHFLAKAGFKQGQPYTVEGYFRAPQTQVYQLQIRDTRGVSVKLNGQAVAVPESSGWVFLPLSLAEGWHEVEISGKTPKNARVDIRMGGNGTYTVARVLHHRPRRGLDVIPKK